MDLYPFFKTVCDRDLPDFEAVAREITAGRHRRPRMRLMSAAALVAIVAAAGAALLPRLTVPTADPAPAAAGTAPAAETAAGPAQQPNTASETVVFHDLPAEETAAALDVGMSKLLMEHSQPWTLAQILDYWGFDPLPDLLPEGLSPAFDDASTWQYADCDGLLWDQFAFTWREHPAGSEGYDPLERSLTVAAATGEIFQCGIWMFEEDMAPSEIGGVAMMLGRREMTYGPYTDGPDGERIPAGYYPLLEAQFEYGGLRFQVRAENVTEAEFLAALRSMVD